MKLSSFLLLGTVSLSGLTAPDAAEAAWAGLLPTLSGSADATSNATGVLLLADGGNDNGNSGSDDSNDDEEDDENDDHEDENDDHGDENDDENEDDHEEDASGSGRDEPRIPGGSGCDDPNDVNEHPECRV